MPPGAGFPTTRMRRLRYSPGVRRMVEEVQLSASRLILPLFVREGLAQRQPISSMPGHFQLPLDDARREAAEAAELGLGGVILFGLPLEKDQDGAGSCSDDGIIQQAVAAIKREAPGLVVITDVCLCEYTAHGHCGVVERENGTFAGVDNDATLELIARQAVSHAQAGADIVAPSGMMDGMVAAIRSALDANGQVQTPILSYAAKYASSFYAPFRVAADSAPGEGDRRGYQMDPAASPGQALREVALDLAEGADMVMVKPALAYLDIVRLVHDNFPGVPLAVYNVSGEFSLVKAAAERGWIDERAVVLESLTAMHRAGANIVLTYWAKEVARWLR